LGGLTDCFSLSASALVIEAEKRYLSFRTASAVTNLLFVRGQADSSDL